MKKIFSNKFVLFILGYMTLVPFAWLSYLIVLNYNQNIYSSLLSCFGFAAGLIGITLSLKNKKLSYLYGITTAFIVMSMGGLSLLIPQLQGYLYKSCNIITFGQTIIAFILPYSGDGLMIYPIFICPIIAVVLLALSVTFTIVFKTQKKKSADTAVTD